MLSSNHQSNEYDNPFSSSSDPYSTFIEPDLDLTGQSTRQPSQPTVDSTPSSYSNPFANPALSGNIGSSTRSPVTNPSASSTTYQYTGEDTLDEPVSVTILRDLKKVANKMLQVLHPKGDRHVLRDWDLWGPLLLCLSLAITLSTRAPVDQSVSIFTGVFVIVWLGAAVVTLNAKLLGGAVSFFQSVCVIGYCLFPLVAASIVSIFVHLIWIRLPIAIVTFAWSTYASVGFLSESQINLSNRRALTVYPLCLFYMVISWLILVS
ncbi:Yip1 domain-containing protein [Halteromyces radiatus]|uniref:Yip1 domain-containing protein n=1 Tax=Halteromyces radiatus TaxID=101107 RepID=UPI002220C44D|nr:Yip1 domain-containing protein [Halteromyces radiatus]KAI8092680.1 Yip1 domain-containing protein [Halteromyces radiatus]